MCSVIIQQVDARIDLAAHGVCNNTNGAANARLPRAKRHSVKRACAVKWQPGATCDTLCSCHANAYARERARSSTCDNSVNVGHGQPSSIKCLLNRAYKLYVCLTMTQVIRRRQHLDVEPAVRRTRRDRAVRDRIAPGQTRDRTRQHVCRRINRKHHVCFIFYSKHKHSSRRKNALYHANISSCNSITIRQATPANSASPNPAKLLRNGCLNRKNICLKSLEFCTQYNIK